MICDRCKKKKICWTYKDKPPKECSRFRPFTHFDRIKAMSVEEMAEDLTKLFYEVVSYTNAKDYIKQYLESEVAE